MLPTSTNLPRNIPRSVMLRRVSRFREADPPLCRSYRAIWDTLPVHPVCAYQFGTGCHGRAWGESGHDSPACMDPAVDPRWPWDLRQTRNRSPRQPQSLRGRVPPATFDQLSDGNSLGAKQMLFSCECSRRGQPARKGNGR